MKTNKPSLLLAALIIGLPPAAFAEDGNRCTSAIVSACGVQIVKSVCTGGATDDDKDEVYEHHGQDDGHSERTQALDIDESDGKNTFRKDDEIAPSAYGSQESNYSYDYTDPHGTAHHVDWSERMGTSSDGKITICHRMGGARVTLDVPDDQVNGVRAHGHGDHDMDTIGRCEDQEDPDGSDDPAKIAAAKKLSQNGEISGDVAACLSAPGGQTVTVKLPNGASWTGSTPGCNASGVSCNVPVSGIPNRGGVRTLR